MNFLFKCHCLEILKIKTGPFLYGHIPKLFFRDADDFDSKTPSNKVEGGKKLVNVVLW